MKIKKFLILALSLICFTSLGALSGCSKGGQDLDGMYIVEFRLNGGLLDNGSTLVEDKISHAYQPNSLAIDISKFKDYSLDKNGYVFEGWYLDEGLTDKWDFSSDRVSQNCTLYAKWEKAILYTYSVVLVNQEDNTQTLLGKYTVKEGATFSDNTKKYTTNFLQEEYGKTCLGLYSDASLSDEWDIEYKHPGGEVDTDIPVYVKAIEGVWTVVKTADDLKAVAGQDKNIYLFNDIDYQGKELYFRDYNSEFNGNGHTISNVKIRERAMTINREYSLFGTLGENCKIHDLTFDNVQFAFNAYARQNICASALAQDAKQGFEISNVTVNGSYTATETAIEILDTVKLNQALFDSTNQTAENVKLFTANIVVENNQ